MAKDDPAPQMIPDLHQGKYSDGHPLDDVHYLECKIILKPERFTSRQGFVDFNKLARRAAEKSDVDLSTDHLDGQRPEIREVVFLDTADFRLYNNAFILRRRISYEDGFPVGDPEVVFKFRHPDMQKAAELDVRPRIPGVHRIKFKAETLPLKDKIGGMRVLYSHNVEFGLSQLKESDRAALSALVRLFPCLAPLKGSGSDVIELVNQTIVEEVLLDLGKLGLQPLELGGDRAHALDHLVGLEPEHGIRHIRLGGAADGGGLLDEAVEAARRKAGERQQDQLLVHVQLHRLPRPAVKETVQERRHGSA